MQKNTIIAVLLLSFTLSGCATYKGADGHTRTSDPAVCSSGICDFFMIGLLAGICVVAAGH